MPANALDGVDGNTHALCSEGAPRIRTTCVWASKVPSEFAQGRLFGALGALLRHDISRNGRARVNDRVRGKPAEVNHW